MADLPEELEHKIRNCLHLINATDDPDRAERQQQDPTRSLWHDDWTAFYERVRKGKVVATCVIDFPYGDKGGLNLAGDDRFLERMYCFDEQDGAARRVVLHAHTLLRWGRRGDKAMDRRADKITSINIRHAMETSAGEFEQEVKKYFLIPRSQHLQSEWRSLVSAGRSTSSIEWDWRKSPITLPEGEISGQPRVSSVYQQVKHVIQLAEFIFIDGYFFESRHMGDTDTLIRGGGTAEFEGRAVMRTNVPVTIPSRVVTRQTFDDSVIGGTAPPAAWPTRVEILFSGANAADKPELKLEEESEEIRDVVVFNARDRFAVYPIYFSSVSTLVQKLNTFSPTILHFACHGEENALALFDDDASIEDITRKIQALARPRKGFCKSDASDDSGCMRLVVLNACHSDALAQSLAPHVDFVIGHCGAVLDSTARRFSSTFYSSLAKGYTVYESFQAAWEPSYTLRGKAALFRDDTPSSALSAEDAELAKLPWPAVVRWLRVLEVDERVVRIVQKERVPGKQILAMNLDELITDLTMSKLQAQRVLKRLDILELVVHTTAQAMSECQLSDASTDSVEDSGDESEGGGNHTVAFAAKHGGDPDSFRTHMQGLFSDLREFMDASDPDAGTEHFSLQAAGAEHQWTCCMLLWVWFAQHAKLDADVRALWKDCLRQGCNQGKLLATLETCLRRSATSHPLWSATDFKRLQCTKPHARCVAITDRVVQHLARGRPADLREWSTSVVGGWFASDNDESSAAYFLRANRFLRSHLLDSLEVLQRPFPTQSYVAFLFASPLAAALLSSYLHLKARLQTSPLAGGGFFAFASSEGSIEYAADAKYAVLSRALITRGLQCLAKLPPSARSMLGTIDTMRSYAPAESEGITRMCEEIPVQMRQQEAGDVGHKRMPDIVDGDGDSVDNPVTRKHSEPVEEVAVLDKNCGTSHRPVVGVEDLPEELARMVGSCLHLINTTDELDGAERHQQDPTRSLWHDDWTAFYERVRKGKVVATCVIDFPYGDKGGLNLAGDDRFLERMYCFDEQDGAARRVVLHVHTLLRWGRRGDKAMDRRADKITSMNVRHALETSAGEFEQEVKKYFLIPRSQHLQDRWRSLVSAGRSTSSIEWDWRKSPITLPEGEISGQTRVSSVYQQVKHVIQLAEIIFIDGYFFESRHMGDTDTLIRGGGTAEFEGRAVMRTNVPVTIPSSVMKTQTFGDSVIGGTAPPAAWPTRVEILFSGANAADKPELKLEEESEEIRDVVVFNARDRFAVYPIYFSSVSTLVQELNTFSPTILHFACHGEENALALFDDDASIEDITRKIQALARPRKGFCKSDASDDSGCMRLVVLNACHSDALAQSLAPHVDFVIGHCGAVLDSTARRFSSTFYSSLAKGYTVYESFQAAWEPSYTLRGKAALFRDDTPSALSAADAVLAKLPWFAVVRWLRVLEVDERVVRIVQKERVPGKQILAMNLDELITDLTMSKLQAQRVLKRLDILELVVHTTAQAMSECQLSEDQSAASTDLREESGDEGVGEVVFATKHGGDPDSFRTHMQGLFSDMLEFIDASDPDAGTEHFSLQAAGAEHQWTCCMLLWVWFAQHAKLDADARALWKDCLLQGCNQGKLLATLETCLRRSATSHPLWSATDFKRLQCTKPHARCVAITDRMVQHLARGRTAELKKWSTSVVGGWFSNDEPATAYFLRANRFLRSHLLDSLEVLQRPFQTC